MHKGCSLWELPLPAAAADPETSKQAARDLIASGQRDRDVIRVANLVAMHRGATSRELGDTADAFRMGMDRYAVARRLSEAEALGMVRRGPSRRCRISGKAALTWFDVEQGGVSDAETDR
jgi:hypothetical protein